MKSKTSVTLSTAVLEELDKVVGKNGNRSQVIEKAVHEYVQRLLRDELGSLPKSALKNYVGSLSDDPEFHKLRHALREALDVA